MQVYLGTPLTSLMRSMFLVGEEKKNIVLPVAEMAGKIKIIWGKLWTIRKVLRK